MKAVDVSSNFDRQYQALLTEEWSEVTLEKVLAFLSDQLALAGIHVSFPWESLATTKQHSKHAPHYPVPPNASKALREYLTRLNSPPMPSVPHRMPKPHNDLEKQAMKAWVYLLYQTMDLPKFSGDIGLFCDTQSILCQCVIHFLLPKLMAGALDKQHDFLVNACLSHIVKVWINQPSQFNHLLGSLYNYMGDREATEQALHSAFTATPTSEHDYLTKAHLYWTYLIDNNDKQAEEFVLELYRTAPPSFSAEVREMVRATYQHCPWIRYS